MIVQAFLRWSETARSTDRAKAADALGRAYLDDCLEQVQRDAAFMAMTYLLDDPSPRVRLSLAETLADSNDSPHAIIVSLAEDQPEIACTVIMRSPVLRESDLVDLAGRGGGFTRAIIAARPGLTRGVCAALAEIGDAGEVCILLENDTSDITRFSLKRIAERYGEDADIRNLLLEREDLPADARHMLVAHISAALSLSKLVCGIIPRSRVDYILRDAENAATMAIAGNVENTEIANLVEHLRVNEQLTPSILIHSLCLGKLDFFTGAVVDLSGLDDRRVRSILATGRPHALRALFKATGLSTDVVEVFIEATMLWRLAAVTPSSTILESVPAALLSKFRLAGDGTSPISELMEMLEKLHRAEQRNRARSYAIESHVEAA